VRVIPRSALQQVTTKLVAFARRVSFDPNDTESARLQKGVAVLAAIVEAPAGVIWGGIYLVFGETGAAVAPFAFPVLIALNLGVEVVRGWYSLFRIRPPMVRPI
jgi:hypothetical protein